MTRSLTIAAAVAALSLLALPAVSQQMASAPNVAPSQRQLVFMEEGNRLSLSAADTLRAAAATARSAPVTIEGRPAQAAEVKRELIRLGAPNEAIIVRPKPVATLPATGDGAPDPAHPRAGLSSPRLCPPPWPADHQ